MIGELDWGRNPLALGLRSRKLGKAGCGTASLLGHGCKLAPHEPAASCSERVFRRRPPGPGEGRAGDGFRAVEAGTTGGSPGSWRDWKWYAWAMYYTKITWVRGIGAHVSQ